MASGESFFKLNIESKFKIFSYIKLITGQTLPPTSTPDSTQTIVSTTSINTADSTTATASTTQSSGDYFDSPITAYTILCQL